MKVQMATFATFVTAPTTGKLACVATVKLSAETAYDPKTDYWKQLREFLPRNHRRGGTKADLRGLTKKVSERKSVTYLARIEAYLDWWGPRNIRWGQGAPTMWKLGNVEVGVNPELFLSVDGVRHVVKLYFKQSERLTDDRASVMLRFLELAYRGGASPDGRPVVGVLDLSQGVYHEPASSLGYLDPLLTGEAASFASVWRDV